MAVNTRFEHLLSELTRGVEECRNPSVLSSSETEKTLNEINNLTRKRRNLEVEMNNVKQQTASYEEWNRIKEKVIDLEIAYSNIDSAEKKLTEQLRPRSKTRQEIAQILKPILHKINQLLIDEFEALGHEMLDEFKIKGENYLREIAQLRQSSIELSTNLDRLKSELEQLKVNDARYSQFHDKKEEIKECQRRISTINSSNLFQQEQIVKRMLEVIEKLSLSATESILTNDLRAANSPSFIQDFVKAFHSFNKIDNVLRIKYGLNYSGYREAIDRIVKNIYHIDINGGFFGETHCYTYQDYEMSGSGFGGYEVTRTSRNFIRY